LVTASSLCCHLRICVTSLLQHLRSLAMVLRSCLADVSCVVADAMCGWWWKPLVSLGGFPWKVYGLCRDASGRSSSCPLCLLVAALRLHFLQFLKKDVKGMRWRLQLWNDIKLGFKLDSDGNASTENMMPDGPRNSRCFDRFPFHEGRLENRCERKRQLHIAGTLLGNIRQAVFFEILWCNRQTFLGIGLHFEDDKSNWNGIGQRCNMNSLSLRSQIWKAQQMPIDSTMNYMTSPSICLEGPCGIQFLHDVTAQRT
jgi:hypothetical protein